MAALDKNRVFGEAKLDFPWFFVPVRSDVGCGDGWMTVYVGVRGVCKKEALSLRTDRELQIHLGASLRGVREDADSGLRRSCTPRTICVWCLNWFVSLPALLDLFFFHRTAMERRSKAWEVLVVRLLIGSFTHNKPRKLAVTHSGNSSSVLVNICVYAIWHCGCFPLWYDQEAIMIFFKWMI